MKKNIFPAAANVFKREVKRIFTSKDLFLICCLAPLFYGILFAYLYINKRATDIDVGVVNMDNSAMSRKLVRSLDASPELEVSKMYASSSEAYMGIFHNNLGAFYYIPKNFSADLKKGQSTTVFNAANSSSFLISSSALKKFTAISSSFPKKQFTKLLVDKGYSYKAAESAFTPLSVDARYLFNTEMNYSDFLLPCLLLAVLQQIILVAVCTTMSMEKSKKTEEELYKTAGGNFYAMFFGKTIPYIILGIILNAFNTFVLLATNSIYVHSLAGVLLLTTAFVIAITFFAMLISALFRSPEIAMAVLMFYALPTVMLSGFAWPHHALPWILKFFSFFFPSTYALTHIRLSILGDIPLIYSMIPFSLMLLFAAASLVLFHIVERKRFKNTMPL